MIYNIIKNVYGQYEITIDADVPEEIIRKIINDALEKYKLKSEREKVDNKAK